mgnify:CR=1 FL=1
MTRRLLPLCWLLLGACGEVAPCVSCPQVAGDYTVLWGDSEVDEGCTIDGPRVAELTLAQTDSNVTTAVNAVPMGGTLYVTYDLLLRSGNAERSYALRAVVIPGAQLIDGGTDIELRGSFTTQELDEAGNQCEARDSFTATRR